MSGRGRAGEGAEMGGCPVARGFSRGRSWENGRSHARGRMMRAGGHVRRGPGQPAESQTRLVAFFLTEELAVYH